MSAMKFLANIYDACEKLKSEFDDIEEMVMNAEEQVEKMDADKEELLKWKSAVTNLLILNHSLTSDNESDPEKAVRDLVGIEIAMALDPAISEPVAKLHKLIDGLESDNEKLKTKLADAENTINSLEGSYEQLEDRVTILMTTINGLKNDKDALSERLWNSQAENARLISERERTVWNLWGLL